MTAERDLDSCCSSSSKPPRVVEATAARSSSSTASAASSGARWRGLGGERSASPGTAASPARWRRAARSQHPGRLRGPALQPRVDCRPATAPAPSSACPCGTRDGEIVGVLQALNKHDGGPFSDEDEELLSALGGAGRGGASRTRSCTRRSSGCSRVRQAASPPSSRAIPTTAGHSGRVARCRGARRRARARCRRGPLAGRDALARSCRSCATPRCCTTSARSACASRCW